jgi:hypothetical protein
MEVNGQVHNNERVPKIYVDRAIDKAIISQATGKSKPQL